MVRSKARKLRQPAPVDIHVLHKKTADAVDRGAFQSAREWAKELFRREPTEEHRRLLVDATLGRAGELRRLGSAADTATIVRSIVDAGFDSQEQTARAARELLLAGDWRAAGPLIARVTEPALLARINATRADGAVLKGPRGLANLPSELRSDTQRILGSLDAIARADNGATTDAVASIPAESPFFEWRLLVEGLVAIYSGGSAHESWQALSPDRAPSAIAAPFRASQDRAFLNGLPAWQQTDLKSAIARLNTAPWLTALEDVQRFTAQEDVGAAVRRAGDVLKALPPSDVAARLPRVMYWVVAHVGSHEYFESYRRIFGPPSDDPHGHRLRAIQAENADDGREAQESWAAYDHDLADGRVVAETDRDLARSLVWLRMGKLAERYCPPVLSAQRPESTARPFDEATDDDEWDENKEDADGEFDDDSDARFSAIDCYRRSVDLAPQNRIAHEFLIDQLDLHGDAKRVAAAARRMIATFPDHERALSLLANDASKRECWDEAVAFQERAVRARPHDAFVTEQLAFYRLSLARQRAQQGRFDDARTLLNRLLERERGHDRYEILCRLAAVEIVAGQTERGNQLFDEACRAAPSRLAAVYRMLIESVRMPLDYGSTMRFETDFRDLIRSKPDAATVRELISTVSAFRQTETSYEGLLIHEPLILGFVKRAKRLKYSHADLLAVCQSLNAFDAEKMTLEFAKRGMKLFPDDPHFPFFAGMYYYSMGPNKCPLGALIRYLSAAEKLALGHPEHADLAESAGQILRSVQAMSTFKQLNSFTSAFGRNAPMPAELVNEMERLLGVSLVGGFDDDDSDNDWPDDDPVPRRRHR